VGNGEELLLGNLFIYLFIYYMVYAHCDSEES